MRTLLVPQQYFICVIDEIIELYVTFDSWFYHRQRQMCVHIFNTEIIHLFFLLKNVVFNEFD